MFCLPAALSLQAVNRIRQEKDLDTENINFVTPELLGVDPKFIRAFVTEKGVVPAGSMYELSVQYSKELRGE